MEKKKIANNIWKVALSLFLGGAILYWMYRGFDFRQVEEKLKKAIKDGLSEDLEKDAENDLQKLHDKYIKQLEGLMDEKEKEIMTV